jgi:hypothetical protein
MSEDFNYHFGKMLYKEIEYLQVRNMKLIEENQQLKDRINKAVKFMKEYNELVVPEANIKSLILKEEYKKIIDLLKGDKE